MATKKPKTTTQRARTNPDYYLADPEKFHASLLAQIKTGDIQEARKANKEFAGASLLVGIPMNALETPQEVTRVESVTSNFTLGGEEESEEETEDEETEEVSTDDEEG